MKSKYAYPNILRKIYIRLHMKYCKLFHKKYIREYTAVFKYESPERCAVFDGDSACRCGNIGRGGVPVTPDC